MHALAIVIEWLSWMHLNFQHSYMVDINTNNICNKLLYQWVLDICVQVSYM